MWSATIGGAKVARFAPGGRLDRTVGLPATMITSVMFGGAGLDVLYVTSASEDIGDQADDSPGAGMWTSPTRSVEAPSLPVEEGASIGGLSFLNPEFPLRGKVGSGRVVSFGKRA